MEQNQLPSDQNQEIVALLAQIKDNLDRSSRRERRANLLLLINSLGTIVLIAVVIIAAIVVVPRAQALVGQVETVLQVIQNAKLDKVAQDIQGFASVGAEAMQGITDAASKLQALNMDTLNAAVEELSRTAESFSTINFANLNDAIANLNGIAAKMARFFNIG